MRIGRLAPHTRTDLLAVGELEIEEPKRVLGVQALDQMLDVGLRILRMHQAGNRAFQLAAVDHGRGVHREVIVLAGMIDVQMGVQDVSDITGLEVVAGELVFDHVLMELQPAHAEAFHDRIVAIAGVHEDRPRAAEDKITIDRDTGRPSAIVAKDERSCSRARCRHSRGS